MLLIDSKQLSLKQQISDAMLIEELQHVYNDALQPKQQQELLRYLNHIPTDVMIGELPRVHSGALQLKQQSMLLIDFNELSLKQRMLSSDAMPGMEFPALVVTSSTSMTTWATNEFR